MEWTELFQWIGSAETIATLLQGAYVLIGFLLAVRFGVVWPLKSLMDYLAGRRREKREAELRFNKYVQFAGRHARFLHRLDGTMVAQVKVVSDAPGFGGVYKRLGGSGLFTTEASKPKLGRPGTVQYFRRLTDEKRRMTIELADQLVRAGIQPEDL